MKEKLTKIIKNYFKKSELNYELKLNNELLVIKNIDWEESDFFYFIFKDGESLEELNSEKLYKKLVEEDINKEFSELEQFEKNLNFIYFIKVEDIEFSEKLKEKAYQIEEDRFYAKEKVIFYTKELEESLTDYDLDISWIKELTENLSKEKKFLLDLVIWLTFIQVDFSKIIWETVENSIFEKSFSNIDKDLNIEIDWKKINVKIFTDDESEFRQKIEEVKNSYKDYNLKNDELTDFEENLFSLYWKWKEELKNEILSFKYVENEDTKNWNT